MTLRSGMQVLIAAPQVVCYEYEHNVLVGISILSLIVYVFGIPAIILGVTVYAKLNNKFINRDWLIVAGNFLSGVRYASPAGGRARQVGRSLGGRAHS